MLGGKIYKNMKTNEIVYEEDAKDYALTELGLMNNGKLVIIPKGENGEYTIEQLDSINEIVEWFFSGDWIEEEQYEDEGNIFELLDEQCRMEEM